MFTQFDIIVSVITLFFVILGFFNGAIRTVFSFGKWVGAWYVTNLFHPQATEFVSQIVQPGLMVNIISTVGLFLISLVAIAIIGSLLSSTISGTIGGWLDKFLGISFGALQGFAVASIIHYCAVLFSSGKPPAWLIEGQTFEITQTGANYFDKILKNKMNDMNFAVDNAKNSVSNFTAQLGFNPADFVPKSQKENVDMGALGSKALELKSDGMKPAEIQKLIGQENFLNQFIGIANAMKPGGNAGGSIPTLKLPNGAGASESSFGNLFNTNKASAGRVELKEKVIEDSSKVGFESENLEEIK